MRGVVAAGHPLTAEAGAEVLREGGNAFDAAICAVLASLAVESQLTGLGAGGFLLAHTASGEDHLLDFFVEAGGRGIDPSARGELVAVEVLFDETPQMLQHRAGVLRRARRARPGCGRCRSASARCRSRELVEPGVRYAREGVTGVGRCTPTCSRCSSRSSPTIPRRGALRARGTAAARRARCSASPTSPTRSSGWRAEGPDWIYRGDGAARICDWVSERGGALRPRGLRRLRGDRAHARSRLRTAAGRCSPTRRRRRAAS